jgi:DNA-binding PadR family transcriptional regulator
LTSTGLRGSSDRSILILTSLADGPKHGYALIQDIEELSGLTLGAGTLYGCLAKLEQAGLIEPLPSEDRRRPYQMTGAGRALLEERLEEARRIANIGLKRIRAAVR